MGVFSRKTNLERGIDQMEHSAAAAVEQLAETIRERVDNETGEQIAKTLARLAERVDAMDLADQVKRSRKQVQKAAKRVSKQVEQGSHQLAAMGAKSVPEEPTEWIMPSLVGFLLGVGTGFFLGRFFTERREEERH